MPLDRTAQLRGNRRVDKPDLKSHKQYCILRQSTLEQVADANIILRAICNPVYLPQRLSTIDVGFRKSCDQW